MNRFAQWVCPLSLSTCKLENLHVKCVVFVPPFHAFFSSKKVVNLPLSFRLGIRQAHPAFLFTITIDL